MRPLLSGLFAVVSAFIAVYTTYEHDVISAEEMAGMYFVSFVFGFSSALLVLP